MSNYTGPKLRRSRRLGVPIATTAKHAEVLEKKTKATRPRRRQRSLYGRQLEEKQKMAFYYNIGNKQIRAYLKEAQKSPESNTDALMGIIESRLDNALRRVGWARTIWQARKVVAHGHILVNGRRVDRPGYLLKPNDTIAPKEKSKDYVKSCADSAENVNAPGWIVPTENKMEAQVIRQPKMEDIQLPFNLDCSMVVEFFSK